MSRLRAVCCAPGLTLKLNQVSRATRSSLRDRTDQATGTVTASAVAWGLFGCGRIFLIAACWSASWRCLAGLKSSTAGFGPSGVVGGLATVARGGGCRRWRPPGSPPVTALSVPDQPFAGGGEGQSAEVGPERGGKGYGGEHPARTIGAALGQPAPDDVALSGRVQPQMPIGLILSQPCLAGLWCGDGNRRAGWKSDVPPARSAGRHPAPDRGDRNPGADRATLFSDSCCRRLDTPRGTGCPAYLCAPEPVSARTRPLLD